MQFALQFLGSFDLFLGCISLMFVLKSSLSLSVSSRFPIVG